jgi:hypothetical protein
MAKSKLWDFGCEFARAAVSRRPPIPLYRIVAHTVGYTHTVKVWDLSIVQGPFPDAPRQTLPIRNFSFAAWERHSTSRDAAMKCDATHSDELFRCSCAAARDNLSDKSQRVGLEALAAGERLSHVRLHRLLHLRAVGVHGAPARSTRIEGELGLSWSRAEAMQKLRIVPLDFVGDRSRSRFATPADSPLQDCSPYRGKHVRRESVGVVQRSKEHFLSPRAKP